MEDHQTTKNIKGNPYWFLQIIIIIMAVAIGALGHSLLLRYQKDFGLVRQAREIILENAIAEVPDELQLQHAMIRGMLETLNDPYAVFVEADEHEIQSDQLQGNFGGIGVQLQKDTQNNWRIYPLPESPAIKSGIQDGDVLIQVGDLPITSEIDEMAILAAIRGPNNQTIVITVQRDEVLKTFRIQRQSIPIPSATWHLLSEAPQIGMIIVNRIAETSTEEIQKAVEASREKGATSFIIDLRDNGGGLVKTGIEISQLFLENGKIIHRQDKDAQTNIVEVERPGPFSDLSLVVFINENTASSAEIVAGTLKANQRAILIGHETYGKTSIQYVFDLQDGSSVHLTSSKWWIPGVDFPLIPDVTIEMQTDEGEWIQAAIDILSNQ